MIEKRKKQGSLDIPKENATTVNDRNEGKGRLISFDRIQLRIADDRNRNKGKIWLYRLEKGEWW